MRGSRASRRSRPTTPPAQARSVYWPHASVSSQAGWSNRQNDTLDADQRAGRAQALPAVDPGVERGLAVGLHRPDDLRPAASGAASSAASWRPRRRRWRRRSSASASASRCSSATSPCCASRRWRRSTRNRSSEAEWLDRQAALLLESGPRPGGRARAGRRCTSRRRASQLTQPRATSSSDARAALARRHRRRRRRRRRHAAGARQRAGGAAPTERRYGRRRRCAAVPELRILDLRRRMEELSLAAARAERLPTLSVRGGYFHYGTKRFDSFEDEVAVGVDLQGAGVRRVSNLERDRGREQGGRSGAPALRRDARRQARARRASWRAGWRRLQQQPALAERRATHRRERQRLADLSLQAQRGTLPQALAARADAARDAQRRRSTRASIASWCGRPCSARPGGWPRRWSASRRRAALTGRRPSHHVGRACAACCDLAPLALARRRWCRCGASATRRRWCRPWRRGARRCACWSRPTARSSRSTTSRCARGSTAASSSFRDAGKRVADRRRDRPLRRRAGGRRQLATAESDRLASLEALRAARAEAVRGAPSAPPPTRRCSGRRR